MAFKQKGTLTDDDMPKFSGGGTVGAGAIFGGDQIKIFVKFALVRLILTSFVFGIVHMKCCIGIGANISQSDQELSF